MKMKTTKLVGIRLLRVADMDSTVYLERFNEVLKERDEARAALIESRVREARLREALTELRALVRGECPSLLEESSGGDAHTAERIEVALADTSATEWLRGLLEEVAAAARDAGQHDADHLKVQSAPTNAAIIDEVLRGAR